MENKEDLVILCCIGLKLTTAPHQLDVPLKIMSFAGLRTNLETKLTSLKPQMTTRLVLHGLGFFHGIFGTILTSEKYSLDTEIRCTFLQTYIGLYNVLHNSSSEAINILRVCILQDST